MSKNILSILNFSAGLHAEAEATMLPGGAMHEDGSDLVFHKGTARVREGRERHTVLTGLTYGLRGIWEYNDPDDTLDASRLVAVANDSLYYTTTNTQTTFSAISGGTVDQYNQTRAEQFKDALYIVDGVAAVKKWDPVNGISSLTDLDGPTVAPTIAVQQVMADLTNAEGQSLYGRGHTTPTDDETWAAMQPNEFSLTLFDGDPADYYAMCARGLNTAANTKGDHTASIVLELITDSDNATGFGEFTQVIPGGPIDLSNVDALQINWQWDCDSGTPSANVYFSEDGTTWQGPYALTFAARSTDTWYEDSLDISAVATADKDAVSHIKVRFVGNEAGAVSRKEFDSSVYQSGHSDAISLIIDGIYAAPTTALVDTGKYEFTYTYDYGDGSDVTLESPCYQNTETGPEDIAFPFIEVTSHLTFGFVITGTKDEAVTANAINIYCMHNTDQWERIGRVNIMRDVSTASWSGDVVTLTTTSDHDYQADEDVLVTGVDPSGYNVSNVNMDSIPSATQITYAVVGGPGAYSSGGETRVYDVHDYSLEWDGLFPQPPIYGDLYVQAPPVGCTMLREWKGRMLYAKADTLYISNWDDAEHVPLTPMEQVPVHYGGWMRVGADGKDITGIGVLGSYAVVFKENGCFLVEGDSPPFVWLPLNREIGCDSHETIRQVEGNLLTWAGNNSVWAWDGQQVFALGADPNDRKTSPIGALLREYADDYGKELMTDAFSVYDPVNQRYILTLPIGYETGKLYKTNTAHSDQDMPTTPAATDETDDGDVGVSKNTMLQLSPVIGTSQTEVEWTQSAEAGPPWDGFDAFVRMWMSSPIARTQVLAAGEQIKVSGTFRANLLVDPGYGSIRHFVYVWRPGTGYIATLSAASAASRTCTTTTTRVVRDRETYFLKSCTALAADVLLRRNDRIVVEEWAHFHNDEAGGSSEADYRVYYGGADDTLADGFDCGEDACESLDAATHVEYAATAADFDVVWPGTAPEAVSFVYEVASGGWTKWTAQPGGCAIYSHHANKRGVYASDLYGAGGLGYLYRMQTGATDATSASAAVGISWIWPSKVFTQPGSERFKDVGKVTVTGSLSDPPTSVTLALRINGNTADDQTASVTLATAPGDTGKAIWLPAASADCVGYQVRVSGTSTTADEITQIDLEVAGRGRI